MNAPSFLRRKDTLKIFLTHRKYYSSHVAFKLIVISFSVREGLRNRTIVPGPGDYPAFMYAKYTIDTNNRFAGWLRSDLLISVRRITLFVSVLMCYMNA